MGLEPFVFNSIHRAVRDSRPVIDMGGFPVGEPSKCEREVFVLQPGGGGASDPRFRNTLFVQHAVHVSEFSGSNFLGGT